MIRIDVFLVIKIIEDELEQPEDEMEVIEMWVLSQFCCLPSILACLKLIFNFKNENERDACNFYRQVVLDLIFLIFI